MIWRSWEYGSCRLALRDGVASRRLDGHEMMMTGQ
jgi:hypothetical protein